MIDRVERLAQVLRNEGIDVLFACTPVTMGYLANLFEDGHERLLVLAVSSEGEMRLICPALTANQAERVGIKSVRAWADGEDPRAHLEELEADWRLATGIIAVDPGMRADILLELQATLPAALFKSAEGAISQLMSCKDDQEIGLLQKAATIADQAYRQVKPQIRVGQTESVVSKLLSDAMAELGGKPTFSIVAVGPNSAEPHHLSDDTPIREGDVVLMDFGCDVGGYKSDITRVASARTASDRARHVYEVVYQAHMAGRATAKAGAPASSVDSAARAVIEAAGFGREFVHRTGHGIGMNGHEAPYISSANDAPLEPGNCFSIEPGIYLAGQFGVRIENIVVAREGDALSLNEEPSPTLDIVG